MTKSLSFNCAYYGFFLLPLVLTMECTFYEFLDFNSFYYIYIWVDILLANEHYVHVHFIWLLIRIRCSFQIGFSIVMIIQASSATIVLKCYFGLPCHIYTSHNDDSFGRKFIGCANNHSPKDCSFLWWLDDNDIATFENVHHYRGTIVVTVNPKHNNI